MNDVAPLDQHGVARILQGQYHANGAAWAFFEELRIGTGYRHGVEQRIDAWAISLWHSDGALEKVAYEIKVSRADWLKELRSPKKRRLALMLSNRFYVAAPAGIVSPVEVPPECGLIEIADGKATKTIPAPYRDAMAPPWHFLASIARRILRKDAIVTT